MRFSLTSDGRPREEKEKTTADWLVLKLTQTLQTALGPSKPREWFDPRPLHMRVQERLSYKPNCKKRLASPRDVCAAVGQRPFSDARPGPRCRVGRGRAAGSTVWSESVDGTDPPAIG